QNFFDIVRVFGGKRLAVGALPCVQIFLNASVGALFPVGGARAKHVHGFLCFCVGDDRYGRKNVDIQRSGKVVVVMEVSVKKEGDGLGGPLTDLGDVVASDRRKVRRIDDEDLAGADDDCGVSAEEAVLAMAGMLDGEDAVREFCDFSRFLGGKW